MTERFDPRVASQAAFLAALAAIIGVLAGIHPTLAIAGSFGIAFMLVALADLTTGVVLFALISPLDLAPGAGSAINSFEKVAGLILVISWLAHVVQRKRSGELLWTQHPLMTWALGLLVFWIGLTYVWAEDGGEVITSIIRYTPNAALIVIVFTALRDRVAARQLMWALLGGASISAAYGIATRPSEYAAGASTVDRLSGTIGDPNQLAALLVIGFVLGCGLAITSPRSSIARLAACVGGGISMLGLLLTVSRGGLVSFGAGIIAAILLARGYRTVMLVGALTLAFTVFGYFHYLAPPTARQHLSAADGGAGRTDVWRVGWRMVEAHPVEGVGAGNFGTASLHYLARPGILRTATEIVESPKVAHNLYLSFLAEFGVVGLSLFLIVVVSSLGAGVRAASEFARLDDTSMEVLTRTVLVALISLLAAVFFLSDQFDKWLWILIGTPPALLAIALRAQQDS